MDISRGTLNKWRKAKNVIALRKGFRDFLYALR
ncbi:antitoxin Xre/MbcA/ParS-like domain-containing protein [Labrys neptuniae]